MAINTELLNRTLRYIARHPAQWDQENWRSCFAGHAAVLAGGIWLLETDTDADMAELALLPTSDEIERGVDRIFNPAPGVYVSGVHVGDRAQELLGLNQAQRLRLFYTRNNLNDLRDVVAGLCKEAA